MVVVDINEHRKNYDVKKLNLFRMVDLVQHAVVKEVVKLVKERLLKKKNLTLIEPNLSEFNFFEFNKGKEMIDVGYKITEKLIPKIIQDLKQIKPKK